MRASRPRLADIWSANQYLVYSALRDRPFHELRARALPDADAAPRMVVDLGCGTGHLTSTLCRPGMDRVVGVDSSTDMLAKAPRDVAGLSFERGDLTTWAPRHGHLDCVFSNAALHWVTPDATTQLFAKWREWLKPGGVLAFQVPGNALHAPSHQLLAQLRNAPEWRPLVGAGDDYLSVRDAPAYAQVLYDLGYASVDAWETTYVHVLPSHEDAVLEWVKGTTLRPVLAALADATLARRFCEQYRALLNHAYPPQPFGTLFPFRRIFVVARKNC